MIDDSGSKRDFPDEECMGSLFNLMLITDEIYKSIACDADLRNQIPKNHPLMEAIRTYERAFFQKSSSQ
jgi:nanoRNase/pAp phosphatase (c-di-AMP/oligoRNAs hydrolase)